MKKIFTLFVALFAMTFFANAQYLLQEGFDDATVPSTWTAIDADGDSHNWGEAASLYSGYQGHNGLGISSASYINEVGALTPDNWLITPAINLTNDATLTFWIAAQDASYANEHYGVYVSTTGTSTSNFTLIYEEDMDANGGARDQGTWKQKTVSLSAYTGQTIYIAFRHFNCTDAFWLNIDDVEVFSNPTTPTIDVNPTNIDFGTITYPGTANATSTVVAYNLTADITVSTTAPFAVSADGTTYSTTATLAQNGGTLYLQYEPTAGGPVNGMVNLTSGSASATITLTGNAIDCSTAATLPFVEDFENGLNDCWTIVDNDGDGYNWAAVNGDAQVTHSGTGCVTSASWVGGTVLTPDNWLITPAINLTPNATLSFWVAGQDPTYPDENFSVYISTTTTATTAFTALLENQTSTADMTEFTISLAAYTGPVYIAFRHHGSSDVFRLNLDDVSVTAPDAINEVESNNISVYPNPASNYINVNASSNISNVEIYTISGQKVGDFTANGTQTVISTSNLSNGMYLMRINTENGVINNKFSVVR